MKRETAVRLAGLGMVVLFALLFSIHFAHREESAPALRARKRF